MAKVFINESTLTAIGAAIREKTGKSDKITPLNMPSEIKGIVSGGGDLPEEAFVISGDCAYRFTNGGWDWFLNEYGDRVTTKDITNSNYMFNYSKITKIPFDLNFNGGSYYDASNMFKYCDNLKEIGKIKNLYPSTMQNIFQRCHNLRYLPEFENLNMARIYDYAYCNVGYIFEYCYSLREISESLLKQLYTPKVTSSFNTLFNSTFNGCYALDEVKGLNPQTNTMTINMFNATFNGCCRVKDIIFAMQDDGTPYTANWKSQTIDLSINVGCFTNTNNVLKYNSGITADKEVTDDATYQALKDDKDWFTTLTAYSRYNHDSAVNTINSLPDTSAYLATAGGTNTIKFKGASGSATDGGAINTLTEEEIAVATAKGWTVTFA